MALTAQQKLYIRKIVKDLKLYKAPHTEFVSVYVPQGYDLTKIIQHLAEEQGTASNIKSTSTRKNVQSALEKMIQHLRTVDKTPPNGLAVFCGNVAAGEGKIDMRVWSIEPPIPLNIRIYRCDKNFVTDILEDMLVDHQVYGLVVLDRRDATLALLKGKTIIPLKTTHSEVPGKFKAGGQCLVKDTFVQGFDGNIIPIGDVHNPLVVKSMSSDQKSLIDSPVTEKWVVPKSNVYTITTKYPRLQVKASKDHIFFVRTKDGIGEKAAEELQKDDFLIMPEKITVKGITQVIKSWQYYNSFQISKDGQALLKEKREEKKLFQKELAHLIETTQTTISSYEIGKINAERIPLQKLCAVLGIDFYEFLRHHTKPHLSKEIKLPVELDYSFAKFLGYLIGDGCIEKDRITFFEQDQQVALAYSQEYEEYFKTTIAHRFREAKNYHQLRFTSRPLVRLVVNEFPEIRKSLDSTIPQKILLSDNSVVGGFLKGLFDADGYISRGRVALGINNKNLAQQVQLALLRFGILASLTEYDNRRNKFSNNIRYTVDISERMSLSHFRENIGFTGSRKAGRLDDAVEQRTGISNVRQILSAGTRVRKIIEKAGYNLQLFPKVNNFFRDERMMSKTVFRESILANIPEDSLRKELETIYDCPFLPVKIQRIDIKEEKTEMIDISVGNQNFIANGILVHNSAQRFARLREGAIKDHFKKIAEHMKDQFLPLGTNLKGIIIGGPGVTINDFVGYDYLTGDIKKKILGTKDLSYTEDFGLTELVDKSEDLLAGEEIAQEKKVMNRFFMEFRDNPKKITYGEKETLRALEMNAVDLLLLSESLPEETILDLEEKAQAGGATVRVISTETREGAQLRDLGGIAAILRFEIEQSS